MFELRGLSIRQPYAWAICANLKTIENRTWTTDRRGTIAIHASTSPQNVNEMIRECELELVDRNWFPYGAIIGLADIVDIASYGPEHEDDPFAFGPYCWRMANGRLLKEPLPLKGKLNLFKMPESFQRQILEAESYEVDIDSDPVASEIAVAMDGEPDPVLCYIDLFHEYQATGNHRDAVVIAASRLEDLAPEEPDAFIVRGELLIQEENYEGAEELFREVVRLDSQSIEGWDRLFYIYDALGRKAELLEVAENLLDIAPEMAIVHAMHAYSFVMNNRYEEAVRACDRSLEMDQENPLAWRVRSAAKRGLNDKKGALDDIDQAIRLAPEDDSLVAVKEDLLLDMDNQ
ncbi:Tetratricopeptide repeat protein [Novipirellula aureliae]|uniref:Tetratricopeptide repeat protein n=1 Tax=Novipirellula aureliae TaxID=2527966 RepID=A0A5C6DKU3_9BACT|nr:tetratricopeptide repeat protein [Novipirellula aureliae]TWU37490.1 Tetratricopeptide repeat protein [Novipirellula aureliae]